MDDAIEQLKKNIESELGMVNELAGFIDRAGQVNENEKRTFLDVINSLRKRIRLVNNSIPELLEGVSLVKRLPKQEIKSETKAIKIESVSLGDGKTEIIVRKKDRSLFLKELNISEDLIKKLRKRKLIKEKTTPEFKKPSFYGKASNRFFLKTAENWMRAGYFKSMSLDLRRSNLNILTATYISMMMFSTVISIFLGLFIFLFLMFFSFSFAFPFVDIYTGSYFGRFLKVFWIVFLIPALTGVSFYFFPGAERKSLGKRIDQELPFVVIHMASVSGSGIAPSEIFKIISLSKEYKFTGKEIRKILNQINIYGYDLTTALRNVARATPSSKLSELLNGISVTINSGGDIKVFFEKRSESLLLDYRIEREKSTKNAETFMDIYISIVIAAPMILLMLLIMISVSGIQVGFSINQMTIGIIGIVAIINILFLTFLNLKQPVY